VISRDAMLGSRGAALAARRRHLTIGMTAFLVSSAAQIWRASAGRWDARLVKKVHWKIG
jgi:hypothetical protein